MNPYFQENWSNAHTRLIGYIADSLAENLPADLNTFVEEHISVSDGDEESRQRYRADIAVARPWQASFPPLAASEAGAAVAVAEPLVFAGIMMPERWIEIRDTHGDLVTVIELLSPVNKSEFGKSAYRERQSHFFSAGVNLVEIDLVRGGQHVVAVERGKVPSPGGTCHLVCVTRILGDEWRMELYLAPLREPLPAFRVPLRGSDPDAVLALQPLVDRFYRTGRFWLADYTSPLHPPADDKAEAAWIDERLRAAGLR